MNSKKLSNLNFIKIRVRIREKISCHLKMIKLEPNKKEKIDYWNNLLILKNKRFMSCINKILGERLKL